MKIKELITKLSELQNMELEIVIQDKFFNYDIGKIDVLYETATINIGKEVKC